MTILTNLEEKLFFFGETSPGKILTFSISELDTECSKTLRCVAVGNVSTEENHII